MLICPIYKTIIDTYIQTGIISCTEEKFKQILTGSSIKYYLSIGKDLYTNEFEKKNYLELIRLRNINCPFHAIDLSNIK